MGIVNRPDALQHDRLAVELGVRTELDQRVTQVDHAAHLQLHGPQPSCSYSQRAYWLL